MTDLDGSRLAALSTFVAASLGLHFPPERWVDLERQTKLAAKDFGFGDGAAFVSWLMSAPLTPNQIQRLASHLTISETYFWREPKVFAALRDPVLPELIQAREKQGRRLRIWSAGCASGEEVYSIAMLLGELIPKIADWRITLLATDINSHLLRHAALGVYDAWSFRNAPPGLQEEYFRPRDDGRFELNAQIRQMVTFAYLNLAEDTYPALINGTDYMDLIFCRNVLIYFDRERAQQARQRLFKALVPGGWLAVAGSELSPKNYEQFVPIRFPGAYLYRRVDGPQPAPVIVQAAAVPEPERMPGPPTNRVATPAQVRLAAPAQAAAAPAASARAAPAATTPAAPAATAPMAAGPDPSQMAAVRELANQGKLGEALLACERALAAGRLDADLHYLRAVILHEQERDDEAKAALKRVLYLDPDFVLAHFALGRLAQKRGQTQAAQKSFGNALALLGAFDPADLLPEAEGLTVGRLRQIMQAALQTGDLTQ